ncbi:TraR/DksA family transcriptional regulator [Rhizobium sp. SL86]|uniref:TraR/DksA family transcriptional regulator n=1 Tax=Rhizobium sp. SL86 TaxID=2995148 RepID=UPI002272DF64|nr:TraR/DksA family transcriptional regulator [Rhizobium sp. SL86]MCY1664232.1 TraR/DksA family transcriptional regulator [Rhizobium sp. SL86]
MDVTIDPGPYRAILEARRAELTLRLTRIETDLDQPRNADDDDRAIERNNDEVLEGLGGAGQKELVAIEAALERIAHGTYGLCGKCGEPIARERLDAVPHAALCAACAADL